MDIRGGAINSMKGGLKFKGSSLAKEMQGKCREWSKKDEKKKRKEQNQTTTWSQAHTSFLADAQKFMSKNKVLAS